MDKKDIIKAFKKTASLLELHGENEFKIRTYNNAVFNLERSNDQIDAMDAPQLQQIDGIGKGIAQAILDLQRTETFDVLEELLDKTPEGVVEMMGIKGAGPKKIRLMWKDLSIDSLEKVKTACEEGKLASIKGFGNKSQENILKEVNFKISNRSKMLFEEAEFLSQEIVELINKNVSDTTCEVAGQTKRKTEIVDELEFILLCENLPKVYQEVSKIEELNHDLTRSNPFCWRGTYNKGGKNLSLHLSSKSDYYNKKLLHTSAPAHLTHASNGNKNLLQILTSEKIESEEAAYEQLGMQPVPPELREGGFEIELAKEKKLPKLIELDDIKGSIHNHSTYSDGKNSIKEMAEKCIEMGYEYLGLSDHSVSAFYANGLQEFRIKAQHEEIDQLNKDLTPFKIFKGIESDILPDGSLDYANEVLSSFDFIVASIHSVLNMDINKATQRLITAIENPYTTILGHATGRLLLRREGYPIDHKKVIEACAANDVIIEINANPWRLDLDWRWIQYAIKNNVMLSINPDAHEIDGHADIYYGIQVARKGGLTKEKNFNCWSADEVQNYFSNRKVNKNIA